ncbi:MAG: hypothetical protein CMF19_08355 [Idiomarinaceae bacterium]|nr:hypothetical protein [Idiomarinaceae bacterium]
MSEQQIDPTPNEPVVPGSTEYNQQMIDRFEGKGENTDVEDERELAPVAAMPEGGLEKYYDKETGNYNWEAHAKELQFNLDGRRKNEPEKAEQETNEVQIEKKSEPEQQQVFNIIESAGLTNEALTEKVLAKGDIDPEDYAALERVGIPESLARQYVENANYRREGERTSMFEYVGGEDNWNNMSSWAAENMQEAEINALNDQLSNGNWRLAMDSIRARMGPVALQNEPQFISGEQRTGGTTGYRSKSEMIADMRKPEYANSPAFRQEVMKKMQAATFDLDQYQE